MMSQWYYLQNGKKHGPVDIATLKHLAQQGHLLPQDSIWREGLVDWVPAAQTKGLFVTPLHPPEPPTLTKTYRTRWRTLLLGAITGGGVCAVAGLVAYYLLWPQVLTNDRSPVLEQPAALPTTMAPPTASQKGMPTTARANVVQQTAAPVKPPQPEESPADLFKRSSPAVVRVMTSSLNGEPGSQGSGFFISADGLLVTNFHVIAEAESVEIFLENNARFPLAGVVAVSKDEDIAVLKVDAANMPTLRLAQGEAPSVGATVFALGNPQGLVNTFSRGEVSGVREIKSGFSLIQCTTPISPGSSGGPLLGKDGEVIGITTSYLAGGQNLNFAVPSNRIHPLIGNSKTLQPLADALGRPKTAVKADPVDPPRWLKDLPYEARLNFGISADPEIRGLLEGFFRRELRKINSVVLTDETPQWGISVVALPQKAGDLVVGYWISIVVFEFRTHWDPKNPILTSTSGEIVKHALMMRGTNVLESGVREIVAEIEGEIVEKDRDQYETLRAIGRKLREEHEDK